MALTVTEVLMALGSWGLDLDYSHSAKEALFDDDGNPRKLWALVYDGNDALVYPPLPLLWGTPGKEKIEIGGTSILWDLGLQGIGPTIDEREYLSGANKLDNPVFALDPPDTYWRRAAEGGLWVITAGLASNVGGYAGDDPLDYDRKYWALPAQTFRATAIGISGVGRGRVRITFEGQFNHPNVWPNGDLAAGGSGWTPSIYAGVVNDPANAYGASGNVIRCLPIPKASWTDNFESGGGWTDVTLPAPMSDDIDIIYDPAQAYDGGWVMKVGPVTQHQLLTNADFGSSVSYIHAPPPAMALSAAAPQVPPPALPLSDEERADEPTAFLRRYGYLQDSMGFGAGSDSLSDAIRSFQSFMGLRVTGRMNAETRAMMARPRCGVPDVVAGGERSFVYIGTRWEGVSVIKWHLTDPSPFTQGDAAGAIVSAFSQWEPHVPFTFEETAVQADAHIVFFRQLIDGVYNVLAYAWQPPGSGEPLLGTNNGDITFDSAENWYVGSDPGGATDYEAVTLHELGHAIGLNHSAVTSAVMWPYYVNGRRTLDADDIAGIEYVYADILDPMDPPPDPPTPPTGDVIPYWFQSSTDLEPHPGLWVVDPDGGNNGSQGVRTVGWSTAGRPGPELIKYLRADASNGGGVETYDVKPGEQYTVEAYFKGHPGTDGKAHVSVMIPHPTVPGHDQWRHSESLEAPPNDQNQWVAVTIENLTIPENRFDLNALAEVHNHSLGHWSLDTFVVTRTRGNRAKIVSDTVIPLEVDTDYEVSALMRNGDDMQVGSVRVGVQLEGAGMETQTEGEDKSSTDFVWDRAARRVRPSAGYTGGRFFVAAQDVIGSMWVDHFTLLQLNNNRTSIPGSTFPLTPERTYTVSCRFHSGAALDGGNIRIDIRLTRAGYPDVIVPSPVQDGTGGERRLLEFTLTPPSGYDTGQGIVTFTDISGDNFYAGDFRVIDNDSGSVVYDQTTDNPSGASPFVDATAPDGTDSVRVSVVAEQGSSSWTLAGVSFVRTDGTPATGDDIIADVLTHPTTGLPVGIAPGTINCPEVIPFDWRQIRMTLLEALSHYCDVISEPTREYRINAALPPTIDVSTSPFVVRPITLLPTDIDVEEVDDPTVDVTNRATVIEVIGAEVTTLSGQTLLIAAKADVPGTVERDLNNNPVVRTRPISDATIDTFGYAEAYAADQALREAFPGLVVTVTLTGTNYTRGALDVGDWLEVYDPESGIEDDTNPKTVEGVPIFPRVLRAVAREREHGPSFYVLMLRPDGSTFPLTYNESERDATKLTLADRRLFDWEADPQGGATGGQYLRDRSSKPR